LASSMSPNLGVTTSLNRNQQAVQPAHRLFAAERGNGRCHEIDGRGLRVGGRHANAGKQADARENAKPHALPRSADRRPAHLHLVTVTDYHGDSKQA